MVLRAHTEEVHLGAARRPVDLGDGFSNAIEERVHDLGKIVQAMAEALGLVGELETLRPVHPSCWDWVN